ncbi:MAG: hypothetical protein LIO99_02110 [Clostridiales bacterium]|nr:hypothetical protein [Clostridiales bacterium]MCC8104809.1 hypothetical protein [Clostridiales bacterium]
MRKILRWYLVLFLLAAVCALGVWAVSSRSKEPTNATLVWNVPDSQEQNIPATRMGHRSGCRDTEL